MSPTNHSNETVLCHERQLCLFAITTSIATTLIAALYPSGPSLTKSVFTLTWIWSQSILLSLPGLLMGSWIVKRYAKTGLVTGSLLMVAVPLLILCDAITFGWIGERFLSESIWRLMTTLRQSLVNHVSRGTFAFAVVTSIAFFVGAVVAWLGSQWLAKRWQFRPRLFLALILSVVLATSAVAAWNLRQTRITMADNSARHPFCAFALTGYRGVGPQTTVQARPSGGGFATTMQELVKKRERDHLALSVRATTESHPDAVIVVIESFRPELVDPQVMPTLWKYSQQGMHLRNHFSAGNATTHGMFSLLNGMESIWYRQPIKSNPLLNRLLRSAGYEIGFFAGHNDWKKFHMDDFIHRDQFDLFETDRPAWLESDRRATQRAVNFLNRSDVADGESRKPRLAMLYLYCTHADYHSYPQDQIFQPAADDRFVIPYSADSAPQVWNRYKNSAHSVDRFLSAVLDDDRVAIVTGDHGESFLEDGVCGHGVRVSKFQNMTPAVIYTPGKSPSFVSKPTMHADLLPTLLSAIGLRLSDPSVLDGIDLYDRPEQRLLRRLFVTRNYLSDDCVLIGQPLAESCFGYRCAISLAEFKAVPLNAIDEAGFETSASIDGDRLLNQWLVQQFPETINSHESAD